MTATQPTITPVNTDGIPAELKQRRQWVLWKTVTRNGEKTKVPYQVWGTEAKSNEPATWDGFDAVVAACQSGKWDGIGYVYAADDPYTGIDLDGCRDPESGAIAAWAQPIIARLATYCEVSPSGSGVKLWIRGKSPFATGKNLKLDGVESMGGKAAGIEIYDHGRYFAMTGQRMDGTPASIEPRDIAWLKEQFWPEPKQKPRHEGNGHSGNGRASSDVVERARKYTAAVDPAISGQGGCHNTTFRLACSLVNGFDLGVDGARPILEEYNERCVPPWSEKELEHKLESAANESGPRGYHLNGEYHPNGPDRAFDWDSTIGADGEPEPEYDGPLGGDSTIGGHQAENGKPKTETSKNNGKSEVSVLVLKQEPVKTPWQPFPVDCLPEPVCGFIRAGSKAIGCDPTYVTLPLLAGLASAVGNSRRIQLKQGWEEPSIVWAAVVAESGTQKSPAMELALKSIRDRQRARMKDYMVDLAEHKKRTKLYEKDLIVWKRTKADTLPPEEPEEPTADRTWCDDATMEKLACLLVENERGILCARDELAGWLGSFDRYSTGGKGGGDAARWLEMWGGRSIVIDRKTGNPRTIYVPRASVSLAGCIQPGSLRRCMGPEYFENGLAARLLLAAPPRIPKRWTEASIDWTVQSSMDGLFSRLYDLDMQPGNDGPMPVEVRLDRTAKAVWIEFYNEHAEEASKLSGELAAVWAKLEAYAARLALIVHCVRFAAGEKIPPENIDGQSIASGVTLARWFGYESMRVYSRLTETGEDEQRRQLSELIGRLGGRATARDIRGHGFQNDTDAAEEALAELVKHGFGRWETATPGPSGGRPTRVFILNQ